MTRLFVILVILTFTGLIYYRIREHRYLKKSTKEALSAGLSKEIQEEREVNQEKRRKFDEAMRRS